MEYNLYGALDHFNESLEGKLIDFITYVVPNAQLFAGVIMTVFVASKVVKSFIGGGERLDPSTLVRPALTLGGLFLYSTLVEYFVKTPVEAINDIIIEGTKQLTSAEGGSIDVSDISSMSCLLYTSPSPRDGLLSRMPSSA